MHYYIDVLKKYAVFSGRARRKEYWMFVLFSGIASIIASILDAILRTPKVGNDSGLIGSLYSLAVLIPSIAVGVRRLHDTNRSGWWTLLPLAGLPLLLIMFYNSAVGAALSILAILAGVIIVLVFYILDGTPGDNKYGPNPKGVSSAAPVATPVPTSTPQ